MAMNTLQLWLSARSEEKMSMPLCDYRGVTPLLKRSGGHELLFLRVFTSELHIIFYFHFFI